MTCFWDTILSKLQPKEINNVLSKTCNYVTINQLLFINLLKQNITPTTDVLWNGEELSFKQIEENLDWIRTYDVTKIQGGHDCSICDPFLLLICQLFIVNITHHYNGKTIQYVNRYNTSGKSMILHSDRGHMW